MVCLCHTLQFHIKVGCSHIIRCMRICFDLWQIAYKTNAVIKNTSTICNNGQPQIADKCSNIIIFLLSAANKERWTIFQTKFDSYLVLTTYYMTIENQLSD